MSVTNKKTQVIKFVLLGLGMSLTIIGIYSYIQRGEPFSAIDLFECIVKIGIGIVLAG